MEPELLLCDIGNTTIKTGFANKKRTVTSYNLPVGKEETSDSIGLAIRNILGHAGIDSSAIKACIVSSVVPALDVLLKEAVARYLGAPIFFVPADLPVPLENRYARPEEVGSDRLVGAYSARRIYPDAPGLIVVDFGTAVTFDCVMEHTYMGGLIFPGPQTCVTALARATARLPNVGLDIRPCDPAPGRDTVTSIQHGLLFGFASLAEGLCGRLKRQLPRPVKIIATGGFAASIGRISPVFDAVLPTLLLDGLRRLYYEEKSL